jgi:hypothetical protein
MQEYFYFFDITCNVCVGIIYSRMNYSDFGFKSNIDLLFIYNNDFNRIRRFLSKDYTIQATCYESNDYCTCQPVDIHQKLYFLR